MYQFGFGITPIIFPFLRLISFNKQFFCCGNISDWSIEPDIYNFSLIIGKRNFHTPVKVARDSSVLQSCFKPAFAIIFYIWFPVCFRFNPFLKFRLKFFKRKIIIDWFFYNGSIARNFRFWIYQFKRGKITSAIFTLVAACFFITANRTCAFYKSIGKKSFIFFGIKLFLCLLN